MASSTTTVSVISLEVLAGPLDGLRFEGRQSALWLGRSHQVSTSCQPGKGPISSL